VWFGIPAPIPGPDDPGIWDAPANLPSDAQRLEILIGRLSMHLQTRTPGSKWLIELSLISGKLHTLAERMMD
jgi:hypothetical protein